MSLPLLYDSKTKLISIDASADDRYNEKLLEEVEQLNRLAKDLIGITSDVPESPEPSKALVPMIKKLIESGIASLKKKKFPEAIRQLTLAIEMASRRARWEAFGLQLQELNGILQIRCDAYILNKQWLDAYNDADVLLGTQVNTPDNFLRRATAALNLGRLEEAKVDLERGLCFKPDDKRLKDQLNTVNNAIDVENGDA